MSTMKIWILFAALLIPVQSFAFEISSEIPAEARTQILQDLQFLDGLHGDEATPLHREVFGKLDGASYRNFLESRIRIVRPGDCGGGNSTIACVRPTVDSSIVWLTQNYTGFNMPQMVRLMTLIHESRHTEKANRGWTHALCPTPFYDADGKEVRGYFSHAPMAGEFACDNKARGSYGISVIFLRNVELSCTSCTEKVKADASLFGHDMFRRMIGEDAVAEMKKDLGF